jgi:hypothetical protein
MIEYEVELCVLVGSGAIIICAKLLAAYYETYLTRLFCLSILSFSNELPLYISFSRGGLTLTATLILSAAEDFAYPFFISY